VDCRDQIKLPRYGGSKFPFFAVWLLFFHVWSFRWHILKFTLPIDAIKRSISNFFLNFSFISCSNREVYFLNNGSIISQKPIHVVSLLQKPWSGSQSVHYLLFIRAAIRIAPWQQNGTFFFPKKIRVTKWLPPCEMHSETAIGFNWSWFLVCGGGT